MKCMKPLALLNDLLKSNVLGKGRLLSLDVGDKYVGLAISDPHYKIASPLSVLVRSSSNIELMAADFKVLVSKLSLVGFVVGYPFHRLKPSPDALQVKLLIDNLSQTGKLQGVKYTYWNESFTSKIEETMLKPLNLPQVQMKSIIDKFAAVAILQGYLDFMNKKLKLEPRD
ncbi:hypothetical protein K2173_000832 [Erythroxylum novogranatense]|uniref:YqgF/RNase H-like domain-containing protein n=1 Tax=Erythroxylum novogranatense TaxID=1862640 RepID=A0AAV8S892_9ROSI|nr:hypothetical protein K2173_000832 [Erythroxylum novogranatense]